MPKYANAEERGRWTAFRPKRIGARSAPAQKTERQTLVAEAGAYGHTLTANGATAAQNGRAALSLHTRAKTVRLHSFAAIGLKCALGHENALLFPEQNLCLDGKF
jgi:hypothetical protein